MRALLNVDDARSRAKRRLPRVAFDFIDGGSDDEVTLRENRRAFERVALRPRQLVSVAERTLGVTVAGQQIDMPVILSPTGMSRIAGGGGDLAGAVGAGRRNTIFTLSTMATHTIEEVAAVATGPLWFPALPRQGSGRQCRARRTRRSCRLQSARRHRRCPRAQRPGARRAQRADRPAETSPAHSL